MGKRSSTSRNSALPLLIFAVIFGGGGLLAFTVFLYRRPYVQLDLGLSAAVILFCDATLCLLFFLQHSGMPRKKFMKWLARFIPNAYRGAIYNILSGVVILLLVFLWQESGFSSFSAQGWQRLLFRGLYVLGVALIVWVMWFLGILSNFRLNSIVDELRGAENSQRPAPLAGYERLDPWLGCRAEPRRPPRPEKSGGVRPGKPDWS